MHRTVFPSTLWPNPSRINRRAFLIERLERRQLLSSAPGDTLIDIPTVPTPVVLKENNQWQTDPGSTSYSGFDIWICHYMSSKPLFTHLIFTGDQSADLNAAQSQQTAIEAVIANAASSGVQVVADENSGSVEVSMVSNPPYVPWVRPATMPPGNFCSNITYNMIVANAPWDSATSWDRGMIPIASGKAAVDLPSGSTVSFNSSRGICSLMVEDPTVAPSTISFLMNGQSFSVGSYIALTNGPVNILLIGGNLFLSGTGSFSTGSVITSLSASVIPTIYYSESVGGGALAPSFDLSNGGQLNIDSSAHLNNLLLGNGAVVSLLPNTGGGDNYLEIQNSLAIDSTSKIDLANNSLILDPSTSNPSAATLRGWLLTGSDNLKFDGPGIMSSTIASNQTAGNYLQTLGYILNTTYTAFDGEAIAPGADIVKYTYFGDANLDGKVDGSDYSLIDNGYLNNLTTWNNGDFNYDGMVNGSDYTLIDNAFNRQGAQITTEIAPPNVAGTAVAASSALPTNLFQTSAPITFESANPGIELSLQRKDVIDLLNSASQNIAVPK